MATAFKLPELGEGIDSGVIAKVCVAVGDSIASGQTCLEVETDKAVAEIPSTLSGTVTAVDVKEGDTVTAGQTMFQVEEGAVEAPAAPEPEVEEEAKPEKKPAKQEKPVEAAPASAPDGAKAAGEAVLASPTVRRLARELGVELKAVPTGDPTGRVTAEDVKRFAEGGAAAPVADSAPAPAPATASLEQGTDKQGVVAYEPMNMIRKKTLAHMTHCWTTIPHVTHFEKADITGLETLRKQSAKQMAAQGVKLTAISFVIKVLIEAFKKFPKFNATVDTENEQIILKQYYNIGVAVETPNGLLVPVIKNADQKSIIDISTELPELAARARERKLALEDMQGGTFTVTNLGGIGGIGFTPIINSPEVAILGMSRASMEQVYRDGQFVPRMMLPLSLSYDHRIIDGADAARFMRFVAQGLEQPWTFFLDK